MGSVFRAIVEPVLRLEEEESGSRWDAAESHFKLKDGTGGVVLRPAGINKAIGLQAIGVDLSWPGAAAGKGWCAFGDNWNDLEMFSWAEWSVAPRCLCSPMTMTLWQ